MATTKGAQSAASHPLSRRAVDVLIIEDDTDTRQALRLLLETEGYTCAEASNGRRGVDMALQAPPRLILLDLMMPELDGIGVVEQLRADPRTQNVRIHCLTARSDSAAHLKARRAGCNLFLTKPLDAAALLDIVSLAVTYENL